MYYLSLSIVSNHSTERSADLHTMNLQQRGLTMRIYEPLASIQRMLEETTLLAAENVFLNWNTIRGITLTLVTMKTQETTGITETHLSKTFENTHIFKESEKENESALRLTAAGGALRTQDDLLLRQYRLHRLSGLPETQNDGFTASPLSEVEV